MWLSTQLLHGTVPVCVLFQICFLHLTFRDNVWVLEIPYSILICPFMFLVSQVDFGKPCSCFKAKTWFAKIKLIHKELALTVEKGVENMLKSQWHHKKFADREKSTPRRTHSFQSCVLSKLLFSFVILLFIFLILWFISSAIVSVCLSK